MIKKIRVLVVDDSALIRHLLSDIINGFPDLEVVGAASDPLIAREMIRNLNPDVLTLDVEMPRMDGLEFLERLMRLRPMPVVMISTLTARGSEVTLRALELGAVDFITKPRMDVQHGLTEYASLIAEKIRTAAMARIKRQSPEPESRRPPPPASSIPSGVAADKLIVIGASTGGVEAIRQILLQLPSSSPAILITQHMPEGFTNSFANRLDGLCQIRVKEAQHGEAIVAGCAYIAPGGANHMRLKTSANRYSIDLQPSEPVNRHRPSVDVLFRSVATSKLGKRVLGIILTGMGKDGALGMREMHDTGVYTLAQDEASSVVYGMPKEAVAAGGVDEILPLEKMAQRIVSLVNTR